MAIALIIILYLLVGILFAYLQLQAGACIEIKNKDYTVQFLILLWPIAVLISLLACVLCAIKKEKRRKVRAEMSNLPVPVQSKSTIEELRDVCRFIDLMGLRLLPYQRQFLVKCCLNRGKKLYITFPRRHLYFNKQIYASLLLQEIMRKKETTNDSAQNS